MTRGRRRGATAPRPARFGRASGAALASRIAIALAVLALAAAGPGRAEEEQRFLTVEQAPGSVFPDADAFERRDVPLTPELRTAIEKRLGSTRPSLWEASYATFTARRGGTAIGYAVVVEEIGKHRPITSIVGVRPDGHVQDVAVMVYREAYGGEVRERRFLDQYPGRAPGEPLAGRIRNVAGATLSVEALNRSVQKGIAVVEAVYLHPEAPVPLGASATP